MRCLDEYYRLIQYCYSSPIL